MKCFPLWCCNGAILVLLCTFSLHLLPYRIQLSKWSLFKIHSVVINLNATRKPGLEGEAGSSYSAPSMGVELAKLIYTYVSMLINSICNIILLYMAYQYFRYSCLHHIYKSQKRLRLSYSSPQHFYRWFVSADISQYKVFVLLCLKLLDAINNCPSNAFDKCTVAFGNQNLALWLIFLLLLVKSRHWIPTTKM